MALKLVCEHDFEVLGQCVDTGKGYQNVYDHVRCVRCGEHRHMGRIFLDGTFWSGKELASAQAEEREHCRNLRSLVPVSDGEGG